MMLVAYTETTHSLIDVCLIIIGSCIEGVRPKLYRARTFYVGSNREKHQQGFVMVIESLSNSLAVEKLPGVYLINQKTYRYRIGTNRPERKDTWFNTRISRKSALMLRIWTRLGQRICAAYWFPTGSLPDDYTCTRWIANLITHISQGGTIN